jgi:transcriptional regulator with XRE-family HTH domain
MATGHGPTTTRRRLRAELRSLRQRKGLAVEDVTDQVEWSTSKLIRIENGQVGISVSDLQALLAIYGVHDAKRVDELKELARASRQRTWWSRYQRYISLAYQEFIGAESDATEIRQYHPTIIPGLLQVEGYIRALSAATNFPENPPDVLEARVEVRQLRQRHVLERDDPPKYVVLLDESALRRPVGGPAVMRQQLDHLIKIAGRDTVTMVVVPLSAGPHLGVFGGYALMGYEDPLNDDVLCLENASADILLRDQPALVDAYRQATERLVAAGLRDDRAVGFIEEIRKGYG